MAKEYTNEDIKAAIRGDASSTLKGFLYQFLVALKACFMMKQGQSVYVEKYGDVAILGDENADENVSIETKKYKGELTTTHANLLNTLYNWCQESFHQELYHQLFLWTTQTLNENSQLLSWNEKNGKGKYAEITSWYSKHKTDLENQLARRQQSDKNAVMSAGNKKTIAQIDYLLNDDNKDLVEAVLEKTKILYQREDYLDYYDNLKNEHGSIVNENKRELYMCSLLGIVINPHIVEDKWQITKEDFEEKLQELTALYSQKEYIFPSIEDPTDEDKAGLDKSLFVEKLRSVQLEAEIADAIYEFAKTNNLIIKDLQKRPYGNQSLAKYKRNLYGQYMSQYKSAKLDVKFSPEKNVIVASQKFFYDIQTNSVSIEMDYLGRVEVYFAHGMLHVLANDRELDVKWELYEPDDK